MEFLDLRTPKQQTIVHLAAAGGYYEFCNYLINVLKLPFDILDKKGETPLHHAVRGGHLDIVRLICAGRSDMLKRVMLKRNAEGHRPLHLAVLSGNIEMVKFLLRYRMTDISEDHRSPLQLAAMSGRHEIVKELLEYADPNFKTIHPSFSPLQFSITAKSLECMCLLLQEGAYIDSGYTRTPLSLAVEAGDLPIVQFLLDQGANPDIPDACGLTAIERAALNGHLEIVSLLLPRSTRVFDFPDSDKDIDTIMKKIHSEDVNEAVRGFMRDGCKKSLSDAFVFSGKLGIYWYSQALAADPGNAEALFKRAICYTDLCCTNGQEPIDDDVVRHAFCQALSDAEEYMRQHPKTSKAFWLKSYVCLQFEDLANALANILDAIVLEPFDEDNELTYSQINQAIGGYTSDDRISS